MSEKRFVPIFDGFDKRVVGAKDNGVIISFMDMFDLLNEVTEENKELQEFKDKVFNLIDKTIEDETQIAENIESTIEGDYVKAVNRLTIIAFKNLKKELK